MTDTPVRWFDNHCHLTSNKRPAAEIVAEAADTGDVKLHTNDCTVARAAASTVSGHS